MISRTDVAVVGAGPYGLSIAAHLRSQGIDTCVLGTPMHFWATTLSTGKLKSEGFATNLSEPSGRFTLGAFCAERGEPYAPTGVPVPFTTFTDYGLEFQRRFVPGLIDCTVERIERSGERFTLHCDDGGSISARRVVLATGVAPYAYLPPVLSKLPSELATHSWQYGDVGHFAGKDVIVVGSGASATDLAAHLVDAGARVTIAMRRPELKFQTSLGERTLLDTIKAPMTQLGPGWKSVLCVKAPLLFHAMPEAFRLDVVRRYLGPAPAWYVRDRVEGRVSVAAGTEIEGAEAVAGRVRLDVRSTDKGRHDLVADHVIAATGFRVDVDRLGYLALDIAASVKRAADRSPVLSRHFQSSVPGLYFVGTAAANSFGPILRFVCGADFAARRISRHAANALARRASANAVRSTAEAIDVPT